MVRRRARTTKINSVTSNGSNGEMFFANSISVKMNNSTIYDEQQYFGSPKRKDCKIDNAVDDSVPIGLKEPKMKSSNSNKIKTDRGGITGRTIGVPLATRSQTRTIENFFKAKTAAKNAKLKESIDKKTLTEFETSQSTLELINIGNEQETSHILQSSNSHNSVYIESENDIICDINDCTNDTESTDYSDEATNAVDFTQHSLLRESLSSHISTTENIFLQEPVLTLNVDKSPNQASSIKINKSIGIEPIFSSPPTLTANMLNGHFNQIGSLNIAPSSKQNSFGFEIAKSANDYNHVPDNDNSSCDSGVVFGSIVDHSVSPMQKSEITMSEAHQRKPATPHRILCPSPIKAVSRIGSPATANAAVLSPSGRKIAAPKEHLSPRKSHRHITAAANSKTRRRLNQQSEKILCQSRVVPDASAEDDRKQINLDDEHIDDSEITASNMDNINFDQEPENFALSAKYPTAQQNKIDNSNNSNFKSKMHKSKSNTNKIQQLQQQQQPKMRYQAVQPQPLTLTNGNRKIIDCFPIRRSVRKTKTAVKEEMMRNLEQAILEERADGLKVANFEGKGRGIIADRRFERGEFVVEYVGDLISMSEAADREKRYALDENAGCYMYYFKHKNQQYCIDATVDTGKLGRLVNHSRSGNLITKVVVIKQFPHLVLIAKDDIEMGEELTYDYGDRSKESLLHHPWLAF